MFVQSVISSFGYLGGVAGEAVFIDTEVPWLIEWETATTCIQHLHLLSGEGEVTIDGIAFPSQRTLVA